MTEREAFGLDLRRVRERQGLTLGEVCERTKVSIGHFSSLEHGDISRWPTGIFRRAFIRSYARAVGLDPEALVDQFARVFPDPGDDPKSASKAARAAREKEKAEARAEAEPAAGSELPLEDSADVLTLRLVLDPSTLVARPTRASTAARRLLAGVLDVLLPLASAGVVAVVFGDGWFWVTAATVAILGHVAFYGLTGSTPSGWLLAFSRGHLLRATSVSPARRRTDLDPVLSGRRHVTRRPASRVAGHAHRVRH
jgi:transcriptional regulator with XRE-family HTH domain